MALGFILGCSKPNKKPAIEPTPLSELMDPAPLPGRAPLVSIVDFVVYPERYDKKRIVLTGIWNQGWEWSNLDVENSAQDFKIWVTLEGVELLKESPALIEKFYDTGIEGGAYRIKAEGSFFFRKFDSAHQNGFGLLSGHEGCFVIDRLFEVERLPDKRP